MVSFPTVLNFIRCRRASIVIIALLEDQSLKGKKTFGYFSALCFFVKKRKKNTAFSMKWLARTCFGYDFKATVVGFGDYFQLVNSLHYFSSLSFHDGDKLYMTKFTTIAMVICVAFQNGLDQSDWLLPLHKWMIWASANFRFLWTEMPREVQSTKLFKEVFLCFLQQVSVEQRIVDCKL